MTDFVPKAFIVNFADVVNNCLARFIDDFNSKFKKDKSGLYVFNGKLSKAKYLVLFKKYFSFEIRRIFNDINAIWPNVVYKKIFLTFGRLPVGNDDLENTPYKGRRFEMVEKDVKIDLLTLEYVWETIFDTWLEKEHDNNIIFLHNAYFRSNELAKVIKLVFGASATFDCADLVCSGHKRCLIEQSLTDKGLKMNRQEKKDAVKQLKDYINEVLTKV